MILPDVIKFYCGTSRGGGELGVAIPGRYTCISPVTGRTENTFSVNHVKVSSDTQIIQDSGAFSDSPIGRLTYAQALDRQMSHALKFGYESQIEALASYDLLIDEKWEQGKRRKKRWSTSEAEEAVKVTVGAAKWLVKHRPLKSLILSAQGVSADQYLDCTKRVLKYLRPDDILGLGGWCITGKMPAQIMPTFRETITKVIPFLGQEGVKKVHIWGVLFSPALGELLWMCDQHGVELSTDSASPAYLPRFGTWGWGAWRNPQYQKPPTDLSYLHCRIHVAITRCWLNQLRATPFYKEPYVSPVIQLSMEDYFGW